MQPVGIIGTKIDIVELDVVLHMAADRLQIHVVSIVLVHKCMNLANMNMKSTEVLCELLLLLRPDVLEVLISEHNYTSFSYKKCKFVLLVVGQLR